MNYGISIKSVLFDLGGTLITYRVDPFVELEKKISSEIEKLLYQNGYKISENFYFALKTRLWKEWKQKSGMTGAEFRLEEFLCHLLRELSIQENAIEKLIPPIVEIIYKHDLKNIVLKPDARKVLNELRTMRLKLGIITNSSYSQHHIEGILQRLKIAPYFSIVLVSSKEKVAKPHPEIFKKALDRLGIAAQEAVFVGNDLYSDIEGAKKAGIMPILIADGQQSAQALMRKHSDIIIVHQLTEIPKILREKALRKTR